jgi:hypothetical protein
MQSIEIMSIFQMQQSKRKQKRDFDSHQIHHKHQVYE